MGSVTTAADRFNATQFDLTMFEKMSFIRAFEAKIMALTQTNPPAIMGSVHLCAGQEAVPAGALAALRDDDQILTTYRGHGWALASGLDPYSVMAEIAHRRDGINGGRGGSAYFMDPNGRFLGENSIVGAGTTIACGVALANLAEDSGRVVVVTIGDGAMNQGAVHEAMAFASVRALPVVFVVENNGWSELTPTAAMFKVERLAQRAAGYGMPSATINGSDPAIVRDSIAMAAAHARSGKGPSLLECRAPRLWGHYSRDAEHYRSKQDRAEHESRDPLVLVRQRLLASGEVNDADLDRLAAVQTDAIEALTERVMACSPPDVSTSEDHVVAPKEARVAPAVREMKELSYIQAVNTALRDILEQDPKAILFGEDVGNSGGIFQASRYLQREFGSDRVFDMPIAENAILGSAVGAALCGLKPIVEIMWADFIFVALDQLINQAANVRYITRGDASVPMVIRTQQGVTPGSCAQHSQSIEAFLAHIPGIKVAIASTAADAYELLRAAAADPDPCVVIEARGLYPEKALVSLTNGSMAIGTARVHSEGEHVCLISWGTAFAATRAAADLLQAKGVRSTLIDLRWIAPLDEVTLRAAVTGTQGRVVVVHEAVRTGGFASELLVKLQEWLVDSVAVRGVRVTTPDVRMPASADMQASLLPTSEKVVAAALSLLKVA